MYHTTRCEAYDEPFIVRFDFTLNREVKIFWDFTSKYYFIIKKNFYIFEEIWVFTFLYDLTDIM